MLGVETPEITARRERAWLYALIGYVVVALVEASLILLSQSYLIDEFLAFDRDAPKYVGVAFGVPWMVVFLVHMGYKIWLTRLQRVEFWKQFAKERGWTYTLKGDPKAEKALMFQSGNQRWIRDVISGTYEGYPMRMFEYTFYKQEGKHGQNYYYTVFAFTFEGTFPHLYLNYRNDMWQTYTDGVRVPLPAEFEKKFQLFAPEQYEIEALEIFTPDVLQHLLDKGWKSDLELAGNEAVFFMHGVINYKKDLDAAFAEATSFLKMLAPALDRARLSEIGTHSTALKRTWKT